MASWLETFPGNGTTSAIDNAADRPTDQVWTQVGDSGGGVGDTEVASTGSVERLTALNTNRIAVFGRILTEDLPELAIDSVS